MNACDILNSHNLKRTKCREGIIEVVMKENKAFSECQIRERLEDQFDRTTFYRSFKILEEHKIIHKIVVDNQIVKYALYTPKSEIKVHPYFYCNDCNVVECLDAVPVQTYYLPNGYSHIETEVIIKGTCGNCKNEIRN